MKKALQIILILDLIGVNAVLVYNYQFLIFKQLPGQKSDRIQTETGNPVLFPNPTPVNADSCGMECQRYINEKIGSLSAQLAVSPQPATKPVTVIKTVAKPKVRTVSYVTIPGSGSNTTNTWQDVAGTDFYFDPADYPGLVEVYFEANMKLFNGNGLAYIRLFDVSHGIGVQGSDVSTNEQLDTLVTSGKVSFWSGKNLIRVQAKSLTADTAIYNYGRLRVVTEN
jgi:hypothetical protein